MQCINKLYLSSVISRQSGDMLCDTCDKEREGQPRKPRTGLRSSSSVGSSTGSSNEATDNMPAREPVPTDTVQSVEDNPSAPGSSELNIDRAAGTAQNPSNEAVPELHCMAQCKHGRSGDGDMMLLMFYLAS